MSETARNTAIQILTAAVAVFSGEHLFEYVARLLNSSDAIDGGFVAALIAVAVAVAVLIKLSTRKHTAGVLAVALLLAITNWRGAITVLRLDDQGVAAVILAAGVLVFLLVTLWRDPKTTRALLLALLVSRIPLVLIALTDFNPFGLMLSSLMVTAVLATLVGAQMVRPPRRDENVSQPSPDGTPLRRCPKCGRNLRQEDEACVACGEPLTSDLVRHCVDCEHVLELDSQFCEQCGARCSQTTP